MIETKQYARKPFYVDAVQVTDENIEDVAKWCGGDVRNSAREPSAPKPYVKVFVHRPISDRQTRAFVGDWILHAGNGFKVYTPKAFDQSFEPAHPSVRVVGGSGGHEVALCSGGAGGGSAHPAASE